MTGGGTPPIFLDIESSGIARGSFPIEIGWARPVRLAEGGLALDVRSLLVRPDRSWAAEGARWDVASEEAHGLTLERLMAEGLPAAEVCARLDAAFAGAEVACDTGAAGWDSDWLAALYAAAGRDQPWALSEAESGALVGRRFRAAGLDPRVCRPALEPHAPPHSHAAAEDAMRFAWEWAMAEVLEGAGAAALDPAGLKAALADLPALLPKPRWPKPLDPSAFRRRDDAAA